MFATVNIQECAREDVNRLTSGKRCTDESAREAVETLIRRYFIAVDFITECNVGDEEMHTMQLAFSDAFEEKVKTIFSNNPWERVNEGGTDTDVSDEEKPSPDYW